MSQITTRTEYEFRDVILRVPERDIEIDIAPSILELVLYESIDVPYIMGNILCADTEHIFEELRMDGTERLELNIISVEFDYVLNKNFFITRTVGKTPIGESGHAYNFFIAEETFFMDVLNVISRAYTGKPHEIIKNILSSEFNRELELIGRESAQSPFTYISPFLSPFQIIEKIRKRACDRNGYPFFVYASLNDDRIRMKSLSDILESPPLNEVPFTYSPAQNYNPDFIRQITNIEAFEESGNNDTAELILNGAIQNQYNILNVSTNQRNRNNRFNIKDVLDAKEDSIFNTELKINDKELNEYDPNVIFNLVNYTVKDELGYHDERDIEAHMNKMKANALIEALEKKKINMVIPGVVNFFNSNKAKVVFVGEQITLEIPVYASSHVDRVTSGSYIVLKTKHVFANNKYSLGLTCSRLTTKNDKSEAISPIGI
jgi:hypothetical protein